jgi:CHAT domain-containing protein
VTARDSVSDLSARVWTPLRPLLDGRADIHRLRVAPDGLLNLVPFEALSDSHELIERYAITYVPAGRDVTMKALGTLASAAPVVVVSPGSSAAKSSLSSPASGTFRSDALARLSAAAGEAADLRRMVPHAELYSSADATSTSSGTV